MNTKQPEHSQKTKSKKSGFIIFIIIIITLVLFSQMQLIFVGILGGVAGSFGMRPTSHLCIGLRLDGDTSAALFPYGELEFHAGLFHFRYSVPQDKYNSTREFCLGQDVWFGE
jgi:hypothetical protein